jgi:hypothetical protein
MKKARLSPRHQRFVAEYLIDLNATAAYRRVYGAEAKNADVCGPRLLGNVGIAEAIAAGKARQLAESGLTATRVLEELRRCAFSNVRDYWHPDRSVKHPTELTVEQAAAVAGFEVLIKNAKAGDGITDTIHKFKLWVQGPESGATREAFLVTRRARAGGRCCRRGADRAFDCGAQARRHTTRDMMRARG